MEIIIPICAMLCIAAIRVQEVDQIRKQEEAEMTDWNEYYANL